MAVKDGLGPRPVSQTAKRHFLNRLELAPNLDFSCVSALPTATLLVSSGFRSAPLRSKLESKDRVAGLKHHGSEGRIGPAARILDCQTSLSEPTRNYLQTLTFPAFLHCQLPPCSCPPGAGFRSAAPNLDFTCVSALLTAPCSCPPGAGFRSAPLRSKLESKDRVAGLKHHGSEGRIRPAARIPDCQTSLSEPTRN